MISIKKIRQQILQYLGLHFIYGIATLLCKSLRFRVKNIEVIENLQKQNQNFVVAFWHDEMISGWFFNRKFNVVGLVSPSKDGEIITRILTRWGYVIERGSSNDSGKQALVKVVERVNAGKSFCITPDGPKGPYHQLKAGAVVIAKKCNVPLVLMRSRYSNYWQFKKSWDKFMLPKFFSKVDVVYSEPIYIPDDASYNEVNELLINSQKIMDELI